MRIAQLYRSLLRRAPAETSRNIRVRATPDNLGRALQGALEWDSRNRARRKRLGLE